MKSNPYVYPYMPFADLSNKDVKAKFIKDEIKFTNLKDLVQGLNNLVIEPQGDTIEEKIFSLFISDDVLFGPKEFLLDNKESWLSKFKYFVQDNKQLQMSILGFPFKIPVSLKTNRRLPDLGEVLIMKRLHEIARIIKKIYEPGAMIHIFTEGVFGSFNNMQKQEYDSYKYYLQELIEKFEWNDSLTIKDLSDMEATVDNFDSRMQDKISQFKSLYSSKDPDFMKKYEGAYVSLKRIVNTRDWGLDDETLMDIYNDDLARDQITDFVKTKRSEVEELTNEMLFSYYAYLAVRDDLDYIEKTIPHVINLSVSPKPNRLGIQPVSKTCIRLPYHGIPVLHRAKNDVQIEYLIDLKRMEGTFKEYYLDGDLEDVPFFYEKL